MSKRLHVACIDCTKYDNDDKFGEILALICHSAYLSVFYLISVFYAKGNLQDGAILVGAVINAGLCRALKSIWRQPRPSAKCALLGKCDSYGMPSSHTQVVTYLLAISLLVKLNSRGTSSKVAKALAASETVCLAFVCFVVGYARVHLGYHTVFQTFIGGSMGLVFGLLWASLVVAPVRKNSSELLKQWPMLQTLGCTSEGSQTLQTSEKALKHS